MKHMPEPSSLQRLMREWTLARYTAALERGDLDALALIMQRAQNDNILQLMIMEVHEAYQDDDLLSITDDKDDDMEIKTGTTHSIPEDEVLQADSYRARQRKNWTSVLAAAVLVCLLGGGFLGIQFWRASQTATKPFVTLPKSKNVWCSVASPELRTANAIPQLNAVSGDAPNDIWTIGSNGNIGNVQSISEHWNGQAWALVPLAQDTPGFLDQIAAVKAVVPGDAWAVGSVILPPSSPTAGTVGGGNSPLLNSGKSGSRAPLTALSGQPATYRPLLEHWDGQKWSIVPALNPYPKTWGSSQLNALAVVSANDIWAVGFFDDLAGQRTPQGYGINKPLLMHWDGTQWNTIASPAFPQYAVLNAITAVSANDIWITGLIDNETGSGGSGASNGNTFLHWDGHQWQNIVGPKNINVNNMSAVSANDIWAVGNMFTTVSSSSNDGSTVTEAVPAVVHWNGKNWSTVSTPNLTSQQVSSKGTNLFSVVAISTNNAWAVGGSYNEQNRLSYQLIEHWDGRQWQVVPQDHNSDASLGSFQDITAISGKIWAVGITYTGLQQLQDTLIETSCN